MTDNFKNVKQHLDFSNPDYFYLVSLIGRKKDGWDKDVTITTFTIDSIEKLDLYEKRIKAISASTNTRAYISAAPKSLKEVSSLMLEKMVSLYVRGQYGAMKHAYESMSDSTEAERKFVIDIDNYPEQSCGETYDCLVSWLTSNHIEFWSNPSATGMHIIVKPFDVIALRMELDANEKTKGLYEYFDIKRKAKTLLYFK